jgi:hypothetical protein
MTVDFVVELPPSRSSIKPNHTYRNIMTITDLTTKYVRFEPIDDMSAEQTAHLFHQRIWRNHGLPRTVISDRGVQFTSLFMKWLYRLLGVAQNFSTAFHPQTNGASERANRSLEHYLRAFCAYQQDDWVDWLPSAELALNNHINASTGMTPFFANHGRHPRMGFWDAELARKGNEGLPTPQKRLMDEADTFAKQMNEVLTQLQDNVAIAQAKQQYHADQHRAPAPDHPIGSTVWLDARSIRTQRPAKKLDSKHLGPFKVVAAIIYHLDPELDDITNKDRQYEALCRVLPRAFAQISGPIVDACLSSMRSRLQAVIDAQG